MDLSEKEKEYFMKEAIYEGIQAERIGEVPIGCVIVLNGKIIGRGHNLREHSQNATMHAELLAIQEANAFVSSWRLPDAQMFVTLEPCPMCSGAIINSRIRKVYYGAPDPKAGTAGTLMNLLTDKRFNHQVEVEKDLMKEQCANLLKRFFKRIRKQKKLKKNQSKTSNSKKKRVS
ncbi:tRNA-specific adenosine-34 deaminase [Liquorilactobacillus sucicola DSM 21376 = JCM 15457]|uniref:tRNA-specific adenosine deaminase n=1 Tax=Liquorilactobacillus sucicola DSM 21376 = JCM 15457 TaxID=1423806 RepID=A0A023CW90_9LACO|nr:tRNA adenosine(34) deaminase TadA [Liquorilactobacillus sucicola]KRN05936.1 cytosine adenosine deaminase [Liquorilactobacillus sucicola DSM 21376 = JCM 15457]GAJ25846.1 tRNA-specific adenosine-34 deaminase [Liquorilactobacillus sucicola DSM 21376 = JCM 15457]